MVNQLFGRNALDWYKQWGLLGHNGIDFETKTGCPVLSSHDGIVMFAGEDKDGGVEIDILSNENGEGFKTIYYHLKDFVVKPGQRIKTGQLIGHADNTGKFTTGDHLHFGLKRTFNGTTIDRDNGFLGAIDPAPYFADKDWDKSNAYQRYGRKRTWQTYLLEIKVMKDLRKYLNRTPRFEEINACVYGYWDREVLRNDAMAYNWKYLTKIEFQNGRKPFC